jgi:hypothetical protein
VVAAPASAAVPVHGLTGMRCSSTASLSIIENTVTIPATVEAA